MDTEQAFWGGDRVAFLPDTSTWSWGMRVISLSPCTSRWEVFA